MKLARDEVLTLEHCGILVLEKGGNVLVMQAKSSRSSTYAVESFCIIQLFSQLGTFYYMVRFQGETREWG